MGTHASSGGARKRRRAATAAPPARPFNPKLKTRTDITRGFPGDEASPQVRSRNEKIAAYYLSECRDVDYPVRFDVVPLLVVSEDRAFVRHYKNVLGSFN